MRKPKVGLMTFITPQVIWFEEQLKACREGLDKATAVLEKKGFEVLHPGQITRTHQEAYEQASELKRQGAECLVAYCGYWLYSSAVAAAVDACKLPTIIWTSTSSEDSGLVGAAIARGSLEALGYEAQIVIADWTDDDELEKIAKFVRAAHGANYLRGKTYVMFGGRSLGMYTGMIDELEWRNKFGIEVESAEQMDIVERAKQLDSDRVEKFYNWMLGTFGGIEVEKEVMDRSIRLHLAIKEFMTENKYEYCGIKCLTELPANYASACVAHSFLNDGVDAEGEFGPFICGCECDNNGALSMILLNAVSDKKVCYADVRHLNRDGQLILCNCGSQATVFANDPKDVIWMPQAKINGPGACSTYVCKPGDMTLIRMSRINGKYHMLMFRGTAKAVSPELPKETSGHTWVWPHAYIDVEPSYEALVGQLRSNHMHFVYGDYIDELLELCKILDIEPILLTKE